MKKIIIHRDTNEFEVDGVKYPSTQHNVEVWKEYLTKKDDSILKRMSTVILEF